MSLPKPNQPSWPAQCTGSCQFQINCIQLIPYTPIKCTLLPHHLAARRPWCLTLQGKLLLVCCRHPGPAILGLPSCKRLVVVKMNCAITVIQPNTKPPSSAPAPTATVVNPTAAPAAAKPIKSTDDLIKEFPDWLTGIGRFPGEYTIQLCHDVHPDIHAPRKCPITLHPKVKEHLNKMECMGVITHVDQPTDWVSSITYVLKANGKLHLCLDPP